MRCAECGSVMRETTEAITETIRGVEISVDGVPHHVCDACGNVTMGIDESERLSKAQARELAHKMGLLSPEDIRSIRKGLGFTQHELEELIGVSTPTVSRWETGAMLPSKTASNLLRLLGEFSEAAEFLRGEASRKESFSVELPSRNSHGWVVFAEPNVVSSPDRRFAA